MILWDLWARDLTYCEAVSYIPDCGTHTRRGRAAKTRLCNCKLQNVASDEGGQESRAVAGKPRDAAAVLFGLKFTYNIHYKFKSSQASKARIQSFKHSRAAQNNLTQNGHSWL